MKKELLIDIFKAALLAVDAREALNRTVRMLGNQLHVGENLYNLGSFDRIIVIGAGKATARMASAVESVLGDLIQGGLVVVKKGHAEELRVIEQIEAAHPIPDRAGMQGTLKLLKMVQDADERTLVVCLLSGGASALLVNPLPGITLEQKQKTTDLLLKAGANIHELNTVRKHLSTVKGGRLARAAYPASVVTLILSDVIGDRIDVIASGPTAPDSSTFPDAVRVIERFNLKEALPSEVSRFIERGAAGQEPETAKSGEACFSRTTNLIIGGIAQALFAARNRAKELGYAAELISTDLQGESRDAARILAKKALQIRNTLQPGEKRCLLFGGETTVTVRGNGIGGRNQELALAFAQEVSGVPGISLLSAGTDGTDGPTDSAGAVVDGSTVIQARSRGIRSELYLDNNDSYTFFARLDALPGSEKHHLMTGPTGTNVMDLQILLID